MVDPVDPHLDQHAEIPRSRPDEVLRERKMLLGLAIHALEEPRLVGGAKVLDVEHVAVGHALHLGLEVGRVGVGALGRRGEEAAHHLAVQRRGRIGLRHAEDQAVEPGGAEPVPQPRHADERRVGERVAVVRVVLAIAKAVEAELTGIVARHHRGPGGDRDRRVGRPEPGMRAARDQVRERRQRAPPSIEHEGRRRGVEPHDQQLRKRHERAARMSSEEHPRPQTARRGDRYSAASAGARRRPRAASWRYPSRSARPISNVSATLQPDSRAKATSRINAAAL